MAISWGTAPIIRFTFPGFNQISSPSTRTLPVSGFRRPLIMEMLVVLPAPFGPRKP